MKLRNKKTGKIVETGRDYLTVPTHFNTHYKSLKELYEEWEDYEEPKYIWFLDWKGNIHLLPINIDWEREKEIGNYFETKEEAEKAVEKLKAWKRLKDNGFKFLDYTALGLGEIKFEHNVMDEIEDVEQLEKDLDLLFGGEE